MARLAEAGALLAPDKRGEADRALQIDRGERQFAARQCRAHPRRLGDGRHRAEAGTRNPARAADRVRRAHGGSWRAKSSPMPIITPADLQGGRSSEFESYRRGQGRAAHACARRAAAMATFHERRRRQGFRHRAAACVPQTHTGQSERPHRAMKSAFDAQTGRGARAPWRFSRRLRHALDMVTELVQRGRQEVQAEGRAHLGDVARRVAEARSRRSRARGRAAAALSQRRRGPIPAAMRRTRCITWRPPGRCIRSGSRKPAKARTTNSRLTAPPVVAGGRIYVLDSAAHVFAFNAQTGNPLWDKSLAPNGKAVS